MYDKGYSIRSKLIKVIKYQFIGIGILSALIIVLIFTVAWTKNV